MPRKKIFLYFYGVCVVSLSAIVIIGSRQSRVWQFIDKHVLGMTSDAIQSPKQTTPIELSGEPVGQSTHVVSVPTIPQPSFTSAPPTPTPIRHTVVIANAPREITEGDMATFTWQVNGQPETIHTTSVYYGVKKSPETLTTLSAPTDSNYTDWLKDFIDGNYVVPLQFVGSVRLGTPGTYFYRGYASADGVHYWSEERTLVVKEAPKHEIKVVDRPTTVPPGNVAFTWEVYGPSATTEFTTIVVGKESKPESLGPAVDIGQTSYAMVVKDFTIGTYTVPLRFIGNANFGDRGRYYFRALAFINGKNIWSEEYSFLVD